METVDRTPQPLLLRVSEAASLLALSRSATYALIQSGELPHVRFGKAIRVPHRTLVAHIDRLTTGIRRQDAEGGNR